MMPNFREYEKTLEILTVIAKYIPASKCLYNLSNEPQFNENSTFVCTQRFGLLTTILILAPFPVRVVVARNS